MMKKSGFTLLELVIVIIIIGVLASLALPRLLSVVEGARVAEVLAVFSSIRRGMENCYLMNNESYAGCNNWQVIGMENPNNTPGAHFGYFSIFVTNPAQNYYVVAFPKNNPTTKRIYMGVGYRVRVFPGGGTGMTIMNDGKVYFDAHPPYKTFLPKTHEYN